MVKTEISIAVPFYNEEKGVEEFFRQLLIVVENFNKSYEIVAVNDGSVDQTLDKLIKISKKNKNIKVVSLSRNFGHEAAVTAALDNTCGDTVVLMDGDLQDSPQFIPSLLTKLDQGYDVVYAQHDKRKDPAMRRFLFKVFYLFMDKLSSFRTPLDVGAFCVMRRPVVNILSSLSERNRYVAGLRAWVGFKQTGILYEKQSRFAGKAPQTISKLFRMGFDAVFSFSYVPLRLATFLGTLVMIGAFLAILNVLYQKFVANTAIIGWSGPMLSILIIGGAQLLILGIIGEYLGRIYDEVKRRPYYVVAEKIGF